MSDVIYHLYALKKYGGWRGARPAEIKTLCNPKTWVLRKGTHKSSRDATIPQDFTNCKECLLMYWDKSVTEHQNLKFMMIDKGIIKEPEGEEGE